MSWKRAAWSLLYYGFPLIVFASGAISSYREIYLLGNNKGKFEALPQVAFQLNLIFWVVFTVYASVFWYVLILLWPQLMKWLRKNEKQD